MSGFPTVNFSESDTGLFSPEEIRALMRVEHERALRYGYPIALMLLEVDRLEYLHDLYGYDSKEEILTAVITLLRSITRASDFLGCMTGDRVMAVFPHTSERAAGALAGRLLRGVRKLDFQSGGRNLQATLSIGVSVAAPAKDVAFEEFLATAEDALSFAVVSGGDRYAQRQAAKDVFADLREELESEARALQEEHQRLVKQAREAEDARTAFARQVLSTQPHLHAVEEPVASRPPLPVPIEDLPEHGLRAILEERFAGEGELSPELVLLREDVIALAEGGLRRALERALADELGQHEEQVDVLERRVRKLKQLLDDAEAELKHLARLKNVDPGVASIYRTVQGLAGEDENAERKREMLSILFEANLELRRKIRGES